MNLGGAQGISGVLPEFQEIFWGIPGSFLELLERVVLPVGLQVPLELRPLAPQPRGHLQVNVREEQVRRRLRLPLCLLERLQYLREIQPQIPAFPGRNSHIFQNKTLRFIPPKNRVFLPQILGVF